MRKVFFTVLVSAALVALLPASALARHHRGRSHHKAHHVRTHIRRFGTRDVTTPGSSTGSSSGDTAGTVASFTGGVLTLALSDGSQVSGKVTDATELECTAGMPATGGSDQSGSGGDNSGSGDNSSSSGDSSSGSSDNSGGDARGGDNSGDSAGTEDNGGAQSCSMTALTPGTVVKDAELKVSSTGATWDKVELAR